MSNSTKMLALTKLKEAQLILASDEDKIDAYLLSSSVKTAIKRVEETIVRAEIDKMISTDNSDRLI